MQRTPLVVLRLFLLLAFAGDAAECSSNSIDQSGVHCRPSDWLQLPVSNLSRASPRQGQGNTLTAAPAVPLTHARVVCGLCYFGLFCYVALLSARSGIFSKDGEKTSKASEESHVGQLWTLCWKTFFEGKPQDKEANRKVEELHLEYLRAAARFGVDAFGALLFALVAFNLFENVQGNGSAPVAHFRLENVLVVLFNFAACFIARKSSKVTSQTALNYFFVGAVRKFCVIASTSSCSTFVALLPSTTLWTLLETMVCGKIRAATLVNFIISTLHCCAYAGVASHGGGQPPGHLAAFVVQVWMGFAFTTLIAIFGQRVLTALAIELPEPVQEKVTAADAAMQGLLSIVSDAVVHLGPGPDFRITRPTPQMAALLFKSHSKLSLEGDSFLEYLNVDDIIRFQELTKRPEPGQCLNTCLKSATGASLEVTLYSSSFQERNGQQGFVVVVCDNGNQAPPMSYHTFEGIGDLTRCPSSRGSSINGESPIMSNRICEDVLMPLSPSCSKRQSDSGKNRKVGMVIDGLSPNLKITNYTPEFAFLTSCMPRGGVGFLDWVDQPDIFLTWVQGYVNNVSCGLATTEKNHMNVVFRPPMANKLGYELWAEVSLSIESTSSTCSTATSQNDSSNGGSDGDSSSSDDESDEDVSEKMGVSLRVMLRKVQLKKKKDGVRLGHPSPESRNTKSNRADSPTMKSMKSCPFPSLRPHFSIDERQTHTTKSAFA